MTRPKRTFADRLIEGGAIRLSRLGSRVNCEWLIYNPLAFMHFHRIARQAAPEVVAAVRAGVPDLRRVVDVGCGSGAYAAEFKRQGVEAVGCEYNPKGRRLAHRQGVECVPFDLGNEKPSEVRGPFDLAYCFEVAEHFPPALGDRLVSYLVSLSGSRVLFSAAHPGQGGHGHINEQPPEYWVERFANVGMRPDPDVTNEIRGRLGHASGRSWWLAKNIIYFARG